MKKTDLDFTALNREYVIVMLNEMISGMDQGSLTILLEFTTLLSKSE
jgi:hypothetical protein